MQSQSLTKKEKERLKFSLLVIYGLWNTFEQWCRVLLPFSQWQLHPRPGLFDTLVLNSIGNASILLGSFLIAQMVSKMSSQLSPELMTSQLSLSLHYYQVFDMVVKSL